MNDATFQVFAVIFAIAGAIIGWLQNQEGERRSREVMEATIRRADRTVTAPPETPAEAAADAEVLAREAAARAADPRTSPDDRLAASLAALAVAQFKPAPPESRMKAYIWPLVLVVVGLFGPFVNPLANRIDPPAADCGAYLTSVRELPLLGKDRATLARLAEGMDPAAHVTDRCGGTPSDILRMTGQID